MKKKLGALLIIATMLTTRQAISQTQCETLPGYPPCERYVPQGAKVMLLGDSLALGMASQFKTDAEFSGYTPVTLAVVGSRSDQWVKRLRSDLRRWKPSFVFISLGTNDSVGPHWLEKHGSSHGEIAKILKEEGVDYVWLGPPQLPKGAKGRDAVIDSIREAVGPDHFYDSSEITGNRAKDGIHFNQAGYSDWIDLVWGELMGLGILEGGC